MRSDGIGRWSVPAIALTAFLLRLPYLGAPAGSDEAGYLTIARQWHGAGPSLYGRYWVDRPPLLITLFQLAGAGLPAVRLLGALAAAIAVLGIAAAARTAVGQRAAVVSAV
ncbi:MAG: hypothetical protein JWP74_2297, partial [Marmoricola sp.]|nr:hypothetical protein [Marmoricola sp.]